MSDYQLRARAVDGRTAGAEVLLCWTFGHVDLVPSTAFFVVINIVIVFPSAIVSFSLFDFDHPNTDSDFRRKQRRVELEEHVGDAGWFYGCVYDPYWTRVNLGWDCFCVGISWTVYPIILARYLEDWRVWRSVVMPRGVTLSEV